MTCCAIACGTQLNITPDTRPGSDGGDDGAVDADGGVGPTVDARSDAVIANGDAGVCHGRPMAWAVREMTELPSGLSYPYITPNGLSLWLNKVVSGTNNIAALATRASTADAFGSFGEVVGLGSTTGPSFPAQALADEIFFSVDDVFRTTLGVSATPPAPVPGASTSTSTERSPSLTADGKLLFFVQTAGNDNAIVQIERAQTSGDAFASPLSVVAFPVAPLPIGYTFAVTRDGLGVFYTTNPPLAPAPAPAPVVMYAERASTRVAFADGVVVPSLGAASGETYVRSVSADECDVYLASSRDTATMRTFVAHRL